MKKYVFLIISLILTILIFIIFKDIKSPPPKVFVIDKEVENNGDYIILDNKVYVSQDALNRDFGFNVFYEELENEIRLVDARRLAFEAKSNLCEKFVKKYDPMNSEQVAKLWAEGVEKRNGIFQYATLSKKLKKEFKQLIKKTGRDAWVTGYSSPWVHSYSITKEKINDSTWKYEIVFHVVAVDYKDTWTATLVIGKEDDKWRILEISKDFDIM